MTRMTLPDEKRCEACNGRGRSHGIGGMIRWCKVCDSTGIVKKSAVKKPTSDLLKEIAEEVKKEVVAEVKKRGRPAKSAQESNHEDDRQAKDDGEQNFIESSKNS